jgi:hypothetical protein
MQYVEVRFNDLGLMAQDVAVAQQKLAYVYFEDEVLQSRYGSGWPRAIRIWQNAGVTAAEPAIAVARDQVIDYVADRPRDKVKKPCPLPPRKLARDAQHGFGFYKGLAVRHERKGIRAIWIDTELPRERSSLGQLHRNKAKMAAAITFAHEAAGTRA